MPAWDTRGRDCITPYYTLWKDKVEYVYSVSGQATTQQAENIGESDSRGVEAQVKGRVSEQWSAFSNYAYNRTRITKSDADPSLVGKKWLSW